MRADGLEKEMLACGEGRKRRGRPRKRWMVEILVPGGNGDGPGGAERSDEEPQRMEDRPTD